MFIVKPIVVVVLLSLASGSYAKLSMVDLKCRHTPSYCKDPICSLNRTVDSKNPYLSHFTFGCTLLKDVPKLTGKLKFYLKNRNNNNKYSPVNKNVNVNLDFCQISSVVANRVLIAFAPKLAAQAATAFHPCPYTGNFLVDDFAFDGSYLHNIPSWRSTKSQLDFFRGCCQPVFSVEFYVEAD